MKILFRLIAASAFALGTLCGAAHARDYPTRPVNLVITFGPGSGADTIGRILADGLSKEIGTSIVVENRAGAGGAVGTAYTARAAADGYTLMLGATPMTVAPHMQTSAPYDAVKDFVPIIKVAELPLMLIASKNAPFDSFPALVKYARSHPGALTYATSGKGSPSHLSVEMLRQAIDIDVRDVPYSSGSQAMADTLGGQVSFYFPAITAALAQVNGGAAQALAIGAKQRSEKAPDVPTIHDVTGADGLEVITWYGLFAPAGTPQAVVDKVHAAASRVMQDPQIRERISKTGADVAVSGPGDFAKEVKMDDARYARLVRDLDLSQ
ncbi:tripartite tricarboxylate transporter substrate binding protein [Bordetella sp. BOR01]|uniref:Bug family tripartite tricarboxylate transporter substrate binding protein n=1 Tax=Bordetella sp. BOR01 TaxID=2854779 RepID=UPI001C47B373|nr:tripartite tricarboxylate transporter substrate binding protein [Bordetella sp. BOR01]MBV7482177.1 tripartite tricarboxylate transporter substrate binding protein [Bordetella sp. BOR01]